MVNRFRCRADGRKKKRREDNKYKLSKRRGSVPQLKNVKITTFNLVTSLLFHHVKCIKGAKIGWSTFLIFSIF